MKKTILISILLASFASATEETNIQTQEIVEQTSTELQDLGRGYARDAKSNQIYYNNEPMKVVFSPKTFEVIKGDGYSDAKDYYSLYTKGKHYGRIEHVRRWVGIQPSPYGIFDVDNVTPVWCYDFLNSPLELFNCYQKHIPDKLKDLFSLLDKHSFRVIGKGHNQFLIGDNNIVLAFADQMTGFSRIEMDPNSLEKIGTQGNPLHYIAWGDNSTSTNATYWKDKNNVFIRDEKIENADPKSFELLTYPYAKDTNFVFSRSQSFDQMLTTTGLIDIDHSSFGTLGYSKGMRKYSEGGNYAIYLKNLGKVYYEKQMSYHKPETFIREINNVDLATFEILNYPYAKDKYNVYYHGKVIPNFSSDSFIIDDEIIRIAHNKDAVIFQDQILENLSVKDFKLIQSSAFSDYVTLPIILLLKDNNIVYFINIYHIDQMDRYFSKVVLLPLDPDTVEIDGDFFVKDDQTIIVYGETESADHLDEIFNKPTIVIAELSSLGIDLSSWKLSDNKYIEDKNGKHLIRDLLMKFRDTPVNIKALNKHWSRIF